MCAAKIVRRYNFWMERLRDLATRMSMPQAASDLLENIHNVLDEEESKHVENPLANVHSMQDFFTRIPAHDQQTIVGTYRLLRSQSLPVQQPSRKRKVVIVDDDDGDDDDEKHKSSSKRHKVNEKDEKKETKQQIDICRKSIVLDAQAPCWNKEEQCWRTEYSHAVVYTEDEEEEKDKWMIEVGSLVAIDLEEWQEGQPEPLGIVSSIFTTDHAGEDKQQCMEIQWLYHVSELPEQNMDAKRTRRASAGFNEQKMDTDQNWRASASFNDYVLSNAYQTLQLVDLKRVYNPDTEDVPGGGVFWRHVVYNIETQELEDSNEQDDDDNILASAKQEEQRLAPLLDCLAAQKELRHCTSYFKQAADLLLKPLGEFGHVTNPQRQFLADCQYQFALEPLSPAQQAKCFCCSLSRMCTYRVLRISNSLSSSAAADDDDNKLIGSTCHDRLARLCRFYDILNKAAREFQHAQGKMPIARLKNIFLELDSVQAFQAFR